MNYANQGWDEILAFLKIKPRAEVAEPPGATGNVVLDNGRVGAKRLRQQVSRVLGPKYNSRDVAAVHRATQHVIAQHLDAGRQVRLRGWGIFRTRRRAARTARNPGTGRPVAVGTRDLPEFRFSESMRKLIRRPGPG